MDAAGAFGLSIARASGGLPGGVVSARVADLTESGRVNLVLGNGDLLLEVACPDSYQDRQAGDWVAVRMSARPVVLWRLGDDPAVAREERVQEIATEAAVDAQAVRAATYSTGAPAGSGWQEASAVYVRKINGTLEVHLTVPSVADPSPGSPAVPPPKSIGISASDAGSWRGGRPDEYHSTPTQGDWTGRGDLRGAWFYGSAVSDACAGKTVASMKVTFARKPGSGVNAKRPLHLYLHNHSSAPTGQLSISDGPEELLSLSAGAKGTATLPADWRTKLAAGTAKGLAIYARGSRDYMVVTGGRITIAFSA